MTEKNIKPLDEEKYLLKMMFTDEEKRDRIYPFISPAYFDSNYHHSKIVQIILDYKETYDKFPTPSEALQKAPDEEVFNELKEILSYDISDYSEEFLEVETSEFFKLQMIMKNMENLALSVKEKGSSAATQYIEGLQESMSFTFDTKVGLDLGEDFERLWESIHLNEKTIPTGIRDLDKATRGGVHAKTLTIILAGTNVGKSMIKCAVAANMLRQNRNVLYVSFEMSEEDVTKRVLRNIADITGDELYTMSKDALAKKYSQAMSTIKGRFVVKEYPPHSANTLHLKNLLKELKLKKKFEPDVLFVDYLGIMSSARRYDGMNTNTQQKIVSEELRALAIEADIPVVSSNQLNRSGITSLDIDLTDAADSIGQTMTADLIIGAMMDEDLAQSNLYSMKFLKSRHGSRFNRFLVGVNLDKMQLYDVDQETGMGNEQTSVEVQKVNEASSLIDEVASKDNLAKRRKVIDFE